MARDTISVEQIVNDFMLTADGDDYVNNTNGIIVRNYALRGIREMGFDIRKKIQSLKLAVNTTNDTVQLPDDFVDYTKIGIVGEDGLVYVFGENKNLNISMKYVVDGNGNPIDSTGDGLYDRVDAKGAANISDSSYDSYEFRNFQYGGNVGRAYGLGGGMYAGQFRINFEQNRIELDGSSQYSEVVIEYIADEARSSNPSVHIYAENALRSYVYYRLVERKANVPASEKARARQEYYNERRLANSRLKSFTKEEALKTIRKNFKQSPKG